MKSEKNNKEKHIVLNKYLTARLEANKRFSSRIKNDNKISYEYDIITKNKIASKSLKDISKLREIKQKLRCLSINLNPNKELKEENEEFLKGFKSMKEFKKKYIKNYDDNYEEFQKFEDIIIQYKNKGIRIPKLNMDKNNIFKAEPILIHKSKLQDVIEAINKNPKSKKNLIYLNNIRKYLGVISRNKRMNNISFKINMDNKEINNLDYDISSSMRNITQNNFINRINNRHLSERNSMSHLTGTTSNNSQEKKNKRNKTIKYTLRKKEIESINDKYKKDKLIKLEKLSKNSIFRNDIISNKESNKELIKEINNLFENIHELENENNKKIINQIYSKNPLEENNKIKPNTLFQKKKNKGIIRNKLEPKLSLHLNQTDFTPLTTKNINRNYMIMNYSPLQSETNSCKSHSRNNLNKIKLNKKKFLRKFSVESLNFEEIELKSQFESFKNKEEFFNYIYDLINNNNYKKFVFMLKLFLIKFKKFSQKQIDEILNVENNDPSLILNNIKALNNQINDRDISEKIKTIYLRNNNFENILDKFNRLSKNEKSLSLMDKSLAKTFSLLYD